MDIVKAVVTAASRKQHTLPLQVLIDSDGVEKPVLMIIIEEALRAGIQEIGVVVCPGDEEPYAEASGEYAGRVTFVLQAEPKGYGQALWCARDFAGDDPVLHLVGDHIYVRQSGRGCAEALVRAAEAQSCAVSAVKASHESLLPYSGCVGGKRLSGAPGFYVVDEVMEKPTPTEAEQWLMIPGLRAGHYLCNFGMHVLTPAVMIILGELLDAAEDPSSVWLSDALRVLSRRERYLAYEIEGQRYDLGSKYGSLRAQVALGLNGVDREEVLAQLLQVLATREANRREG